jgi:hypothetical protein
MPVAIWRVEGPNLPYTPYDIGQVKILVRADYFMAYAVALALSLPIEAYGSLTPLLIAVSSPDTTLPWEEVDASDDLVTSVARLRHKKQECLRAKVSVGELEAELLLDGLILLSMM